MFLQIFYSAKQRSDHFASLPLSLMNSLTVHTLFPYPAFGDPPHSFLLLNGLFPISYIRVMRFVISSVKNLHALITIFSFHLSGGASAQSSLSFNLKSSNSLSNYLLNFILKDNPDRNVTAVPYFDKITS